MAKYLITGGCGFIGSHLCDRLYQQGHEVIVIDNLSTGTMDNITMPIDVRVADISHKSVLKEAFVGIDGCFHLAANIIVNSSPEQRLADLQANLMNTLIVFRAAIEAGKIPVCYASSCAVYGNHPDLPLKESLSSNPISAYGCDKLSGELNAFCFATQYDLPVISCRFFNVFGPRQDPLSPYSGVISRFFHQAMKRQPLSIYGDGQQTRDFIYVDDVISALVLAMQSCDTSAKVLNVCTGTRTKIEVLASTIIELTHSCSCINYEPPRAGDIKYSLGEPALAEQQIQFKSAYTLEKGLKLTSCRVASPS